MPTIDAYARERHHAEHIAPVWRAIQPEMRGTFWVAPGVSEELLKCELDNVVEVNNPPGGDVPIITSASGSLQRAVKAGRRHAAIMEHGCGQSFGGDTESYLGRLAATNPSYAGGDGRDAELFLFPGEHPAARERAKRPKARVEVVGCPKLDGLPARVADGIPTIAFSFHWDTSLSPETRSSFLQYRAQLAEFARDAARDGIRILGHGHPRIFDRLAPWYKRHGIEPVRDFDDVCRRADLYVMDGVSTLYEFASTGRSVVVLNSPWYRPEIDHGLRFWSAANVGEQVWEPYDIKRVCRYHLANPLAWRTQREAALDLVYSYRSGAAERAARVIEDWAQDVG